MDTKIQRPPIAPAASREKLSHAITIHQQGQTDFMTFVHHAAEAGVAIWTTDLQEMCVSYNHPGRTHPILNASAFSFNAFSPQRRLTAPYPGYLPPV